MTRAEAIPTGDSIAQKVQALHQGDSLASIVQDLNTAHARRPGLWQQDLAKVNQSLHDQGILPGVDIVGVRGQDLVTKDAQGHVDLYDATNPTSHKSLDAGGTTTINGRDAVLSADGSGTLAVKKGDSLWSISRDVLKAQGVDNPSDNQIANYVKELNHANTQSLKNLKPGDVIDLPPAMKGGYDTSFAPERGDAITQKEQDAATEKWTDATNALNKFGYGIFGSSNMTKDDITSALARTDLTDQDKQGLQFLQENFDQLKNVGQGFLPNFRGDAIYLGGLDQWKSDQFQQAEIDSLQAFQDRKGS
jgi:hypothetical protein